jgi:hypothetical protein
LEIDISNFQEFVKKFSGNAEFSLFILSFSNLRHPVHYQLSSMETGITKLEIWHNAVAKHR